MNNTELWEVITPFPPTVPVPLFSGEAIVLPDVYLATKKNVSSCSMRGKSGSLRGVCKHMEIISAVVDLQLALLWGQISVRAIPVTHRIFNYPKIVAIWLVEISNLVLRTAARAASSVLIQIEKDAHRCDPTSMGILTLKTYTRPLRLP